MNVQEHFSVDWSSLPKPVDDGGADHLVGYKLPSVSLPSTVEATEGEGEGVVLAELKGWTVLFAYPMMAPPDQPMPEAWDLIAGARGCTPQSCAFRDRFAELRAAGIRHIFGLSMQQTAVQREAALRLHLPFPLLSDSQQRFAQALSLPTFTFTGMVLLKRLTLVIHDGKIEKIFYPIFPPDQNASDVLKWFKDSTRS